MPEVGAEACEACGTLYVKETRRGRPREFCSDECRRASGAIREGLRAVEYLQEKSTSAAWLRLRAQLWQALNMRPWNRGVARARPCAPAPQG